MGEAAPVRRALVADVMDLIRSSSFRAWYTITTTTRHTIACRFLFGYFVVSTADERHGLGSLVEAVE